MYFLRRVRVRTEDKHLTHKQDDWQANAKAEVCARNRGVEVSPAAINPMGAADHEYAITQSRSNPRAALSDAELWKEPVMPRPKLKTNIAAHPLG